MGIQDHPNKRAVVLCVGEGQGTKKMEVGEDQTGHVYVDVLDWTQEKVTVSRHLGERRRP